MFPMIGIYHICRIIYHNHKYYTKRHRHKCHWIAATVANTTGPTHANLLERVVPRSRLASHELNTPQGQQRAAKQRWMRWTQCSIKKWSFVNFQFQFHERIAHKLIYMTHEPCYIYFLSLALAWDLITPNRQSVLRDTRTAFSLPPVIVSLRIEYWCFIFWWTCSPNVNTKQMLGQVWQYHVYVANNFRKQQWSPQWKTRRHMWAPRGVIDP